MVVGLFVLSRSMCSSTGNRARGEVWGLLSRTPCRMTPWDPMMSRFLSPWCWQVCPVFAVFYLLNLHISWYGFGWRPRTWEIQHDTVWDRARVCARVCFGLFWHASEITIWGFSWDGGSDRGALRLVGPNFLVRFTDSPLVWIWVLQRRLSGSKTMRSQIGEQLDWPKSFIDSESCRNAILCKHGRALQMSCYKIR